MSKTRFDKTIISLEGSNFSCLKVICFKIGPFQNKILIKQYPYPFICKHIVFIFPFRC